MDGLESVKRLRLLATRPLKARRSLPFALPCEKLLLPFLWDRELLRYTATCRACHSSAHHNGRLELSIVARLPRNLGAYGAQRFAERLDLGSMCSINIDSVTGNASTDKQLESLGCFMVGVGRQANIARNLCSTALPLLPKLRTINLPIVAEWSNSLMETLVATLLWEAPRIQQLNLPKGCRLRPPQLKKELQEHPRRRQNTTGWLPVETLASLVNEKILNIMLCKSPEDTFLLGQLARALTRSKELTVFACQMQEMTEIGEEKMLQMLKAFVRGFCTNDLSTPLGPPAIEHLTFDLLTFRGAGQSLAQLINALPSLRSVRVGRAEHSRLGPGCLLDTGSLMVLAHAAPEALSKLAFIELEGARGSDSLSLAPLLSSASNLRVLDLSHSDFGDVEAQLWAAARVGPLPLQCLGFRHCRLKAPAGAAALARILNNLGQVKHLRIQANRWRVESHRAFAEQLAPCAAQGLQSLEAGYCVSTVQVPLNVMAADAPDVFRAAEAEFPRASPSPSRRAPSASRPPLRLALRRSHRGGGDGPAASDTASAPAGADHGGAGGTGRPPMVLCSERLNFLSHFGAGLWLAAALTRLGGLQEIRLENLPVGLVALQVLRRRLRTPLEHLRKLALGKGCTGLKEQQAGQELAFALAKMSPELQCLDLAGSDATHAMLLGMVEAFSSSSTPHLDGVQSQAGPPPRLMRLNSIDVDEADFPDCSSLLQAFLKSRGCPSLQGIRRHRGLQASGNWRLLAEAQQTA